MTDKLFLHSAFLSTFLAQSTVCIAAGLLASFVLSRYSARAHQVLFLAMVAAVIMPTMSILVKHYQLGLFVAELPTARPESRPSLPPAPYETSTVAGDLNIPHEASAVEQSQAPATVSSLTAVFSWRSLLFGLWFVASLVLLVRLLIVFVLGIRLLKRATPVTAPNIRNAARTAARRLGLNVRVDVFDSFSVDSPVIWCWAATPVLLVPQTTAQPAKHIDWVGVFCHEFAHFKRRDHITGLFAELLLCIFPWNPLTWWARSRLTKLSEQACDDWVMATGQSSADYAEALLDLAPQRQMAFVPTVVAGANGLAARIRRIVQDSCNNPRIGTRWTSAVSILIICTCFAVAFAQTRPATMDEPIDETPGNAVYYPASIGVDRPLRLMQDPPPSPEAERFERRQVESLPEPLEEEPELPIHREEILEVLERLPRPDERSEVPELLELVHNLLVRLDRLEEELNDLRAENAQLKRQLQQYWLSSER